MKLEVIGVVFKLLALPALFALCFYLSSQSVMLKIRNKNREKTRKLDSNKKQPQVHMTMPYKRYSYDGGSVKRSHRFYKNDLIFINKIAESRNAYSSDVINGMINHFVENPELIHVIIGGLHSDKPRPDKKTIAGPLNT